MATQRASDLNYMPSAVPGKKTMSGICFYLILGCHNV